ncbi:hypothetical protein V492_03471 [Pseudogymnoascus sp. VKM F-4246]|nr:hypothetical protein V492_03471 [Pseudogymnoascus sp. VKM F-4246]
MQSIGNASNNMARLSYTSTSSCDSYSAYHRSKAGSLELRALESGLEFQLGRHGQVAWHEASDWKARPSGVAWSLSWKARLSGVAWRLKLEGTTKWRGEVTRDTHHVHDRGIMRMETDSGISEAKIYYLRDILTPCEFDKEVDIVMEKMARKAEEEAARGTKMHGRLIKKIKSIFRLTRLYDE